MPKIKRTLVRSQRLAQAEGAPHPPSSYSYNDDDVETPQTPRPRLSLINPGNINTHSGLTREIVLSDRPEYDDSADESRKEERQEILREMVRSSDSYESRLGQAILTRITLEQEEADLLTKSDFDEEDEYDLEKLRRRISNAKTREKLLQEDYDRHRNDEDDEAKMTQIHNSNLVIDTIQKLLNDSGYGNIELTPKTDSLYSYLTEFYKTYFKDKYGPHYFETIKLTDVDMYDATNYVLPKLKKDVFEEKLANAKRGGSSTKKRRSQQRRSQQRRSRKHNTQKRNRKSKHQRK